MIHLTDVTLRDGLQMEARQVSVEEKVRLFGLLKKCGYSRLEVTSFVNPKWVPQFADAQVFCEKIFATDPGIECMAFVPNVKGLDRLLAFPIPWASCFIAATETFNKKNVNVSREETLTELKLLVPKAKAAGRKVRVYVSTVFGCPYEGKVATQGLIEFLKRVASLGADEIALSDTIGVAVPAQVEEIVSGFLRFFSADMTAVHFHNTYGLGLAASFAAWMHGVKRFDGTTGGIGGCPYAKGASGNASVDELAYAFSRQGHWRAFDADAIERVLKFLNQDLKIDVHSHLFDVMSKGASLFGG